MNVKQWVDKHRPTTLDKIIGQQNVVNTLKNGIVKGEMPHMLFYGPPGVGKTSVITALAYELFGPNLMIDRVLELNASDDRGINTVRKTIRQFAKSALGTPDPNYPSPPYKIVILDEADAMTNEAQSALRKVMEQYAHITRFCFICNYISNISDPIVSRCAAFRFEQINNNDSLSKLRKIAKQENMQISNGVILYILLICDGDIRQSISLMQNANYLNKEITKDDIQTLRSMPNEEISHELFKHIGSPNINKVHKSVRKIFDSSYPMYFILAYCNKLIERMEISDINKAKMYVHLANVEANMLDGCDEYIELLNLFLYINKLMNNSK